MTDSINNAIPFVPENTIDPAAGLNISINVVDALLQCKVISVGDNDPPSEPAEGDRYIVGDTPTGEWSTAAGKLARFLDSAWDFYEAKYVLNGEDNYIYINVSGTWQRINNVNMPYSGTWAGRPSASTLPADSMVFITDFPNIVGSFFRPIPIADAYLPVSPIVQGLIGDNPTTVDNTDEQIVMQQLFPIGTIIPSAITLNIIAALSKDTGAIASTYRVRIGTSGTTADTVVHTIAIDATTRSAQLCSRIVFRTGTTCTVVPTENGMVEQSTTVWPSAVTISDILENDIYVSVTHQMASSGGTITVQTASMNII